MQVKNEESLTAFGILVLSAAAAGGLLFGYHTAVISGVLGFFSSFFDLSPAKEGMVVSIMLLLGFVGSLQAGYWADRWGRKKVMVIAACFLIAGSMLIAYSSNYFEVLYGRAVSGFAIGVVSVVSPLYLAETAPPRYRGRCVSAFQLALAVGVLFSYVMAYFLSDEGTWHTLFVIGAGLALVQFLLLIFIPETPTWCISHEKQAQAVKALKKIRRDSLWESTLHLIPKISKEKMQWVDFTPPVRRVLIIGCILSVFQQITGINAIIYYTPKIFQFVGITADNSFLATLAIGCVNLLATLFALCLLDKLGRRILLFVGIIGMILGLGVLSFGFFVESPLIDTLSLVSLMLYVACFSLSLGPVTWVILSEIFPLKVRGNALAIALCLNWLANYVISLTFPNLIAELGGGMAFGFFGIVSCLAFIFVCFFIPETKGKSLEQIETMVKSGKFK